MRKALSIVVMALLLAYTGTIAVDSASALSATQSSVQADLAFFFIVDTSSEMAEPLEQLKGSVDQLIEALSLDDNAYLGLVRFSSSGEAKESDLELDSAFTQDVEEFKEAVLSLTPEQTSTPLSLAIERVLTEDSMAQLSLRSCLVVITSTAIENVNLESSTAGADEEKLSVRIALLSSATETLENAAPIVSSFNIDRLNSGPAELYADVVQHCVNETTSEVESETGQVPPMDESSEEVEQPVDTETEAGDIESILQRHTAEIELLKQNVSALSALLSNVPLLEALQARVDEQATLLSQNSANIADLQTRLTAVEAFEARFDQLESDILAIDALEQKLADLLTTSSELETRISTTVNEIAALPIGDHSSRIAALEQSTSDLSGMRVDIDQLNDNVTQIQQEITTAQSEIVVIRDEIAALPFPAIHSRIDSVELQLNTDLAELSDRVSSLESDADGLRMRFDQIESRVADVEAALNNLPIPEIEGDIAMLGSEIMALNDVDKAYRLELQRVDAELQRLDQISSRVSSNEAQIEVLNRLTTRIDALENAHREISRVQMNNGQAIANVEALSLDLSDAVRGLRTDLDALGQELRTQAKRTNDLETRYMSERVELLSRVDSLNRALSDVQSAIATLQQAMLPRSEYTTAADKLKREQQHQDRIAAELDAGLAELRNEVSALKAIFSELNSETRESLLSNFTRNYRQMQNDLQQLRTAVVVLGTGVVISAIAILYLILN